MKNLILILSLCFILFSCFEKEEEVTVVPDEPIEGDIKVCERYRNFIEIVENEPPRTLRAYVKEYSYKNSNVYLFYLGDDENIDDEVTTYVVNAQCEVICVFSQLPEERCENWQDAKLVKTIWQDNR
ncbi:hypothetical protein ACE193_17720 [Bernardetia sp. OM2101]|uniref:DUF6970 domain-containing protein n=1 Tax=Bernardetia sp. OM2101 TaxID=3344876 RepID=UPI0035D091FD